MTKNNSVLKTIIKPAVSLVCTAAICITGAVCTNKVINKGTSDDGVSLSAANSDAYLTEAEAAAYLGLTESRLTILRKNLKKLEGSYMIYSYAEDGKDVEVVMYQKAKLDEIVAKLMGDRNSVNFKDLEEALAKAEKAEKDKK